MTDDIWTVRRILEWIEGYLRSRGDEAPRVSAQWLVAEALGVSRMQLFMDMDRPLSAEERAVLRDWTRRRGAGEPLQYITGTVDFRYITVKVKSGVLIPRPETEVLVSEVLALLPSAPKPQDQMDDKLIELMERMREEAGASLGDQLDEVQGLARDGAPVRDELLVADLCTGTGCVACSIAHEHPRARVIATDIAPAAVALATENVCALGLDERVDVVECDLASGIDASLMGTFDAVVSNPPYVPSEVLASIPREVADYEPALALDGGADGLDIFRRILSWCATALRPGGILAVELHETCLAQAAELADRSGFCEVRLVDDLAGRPRVLTARKARSDC